MSPSASRNNGAIVARSLVEKRGIEDPVRALDALGQKPGQQQTVGTAQAQRLELGDNLRLAGLVFGVGDEALLVKFLELAQSPLNRIGAA